MIALCTTLMTFLGAFALLSGAKCSCSEAAPAVSRSDYVVLLHGLGRTSWSMSRMEYCLKRQGYRVINVSYPSTRHSIEYVSDVWLRQLLRKEIVDHSVRVHFVTHSLGGIVLREYLSGHSIRNLGRVVMLAPPNHGSELVDRLKTRSFMRYILGPAWLELGTAADGVPSQLGPASFECGIIAGDRSLNPFLSSILPGPNDGKVTVDSAKLEGMRDFIVLHSTHTWLMWRKNTICQVSDFLRSGRFNHD